MSAVDILFLLITIAAYGMIVILPWAFLIHTFFFNKNPQEDGILIMVCIIICLIETAFFIDFLTGHTSKLMQ